MEWLGSDVRDSAEGCMVCLRAQAITPRPCWSEPYGWPEIDDPFPKLTLMRDRKVTSARECMEWALREEKMVGR